MTSYWEKENYKENMEEKENEKDKKKIIIKYKSNWKKRSG